MVLKNGLSRMRGDPHVRFLGGGGAAMRRCYPTRCKPPTQPADRCCRNGGPQISALGRHSRDSA
ncbi:MAG: hypothetical protein E5X65_36255, partial [Mesorhizobium sp.]